MSGDIQIAVNTKGFVELRLALDRCCWSVKRLGYALSWMTVFPGDLARLNPNILRRVA